MKNHSEQNIPNNSHPVFGGRAYVFKRNGSRYWYAAAFLEGRNYRESTKKEKLEDAIHAAEEWYKDASIEKIARILSHGLLTEDEKNIFEGRFSYITELALQPKELFTDILSVLFNAPNGGAFRVRNIKGITGEISMQVGDNKPFGVINVGDDSGLIEKCKEAELETGESEFSQSLFAQLNAPDSNLHLLIGSKKFTEGWNSWRVSTMGLMNVGATEGAQIIQLFGRGVRLKGYNDCLKRSSRVDGVTRPYHIGLLETLNIFGIRANYMQQFREYLEEEGLPTNEDREEFFLPVIKNLGKKKLKTIRLKKTINGISTEFDQAFKKLAPVPTFAPPAPEDIYLQRNKVVLNWYPKVQALRASGINSANTEMDLHETRLREEHIALLDIDELYFELQQYKAERSWHNLNLSRKAIEDVLADQSWYVIQIPAGDMAFDRYENVAIWQQLASSLLRKYCERYYLYQKKKWEEPHLEYHDLDANDPNFPAANDEYPDGYYRFLLDQSQQEIATQLKTLKKAIEEGKLQDVSYPGFEAIFFHQHLYQPLIHLKGMSIEVSPVALNLGEKQFVLDLRNYYEANKPFFDKREMYLLRNLSKGRGVGFFEAGNFHPDFILWLLDGDKQYITFIDPKGIRHLGKEDPKVSFYKTIKEIETRLNDDKVILNSFLVSNTHSSEMKMLWKMEKADMEACHIVFQEEDSASYIGKIMNRLI